MALTKPTGPSSADIVGTNLTDDFLLGTSGADIISGGLTTTTAVSDGSDTMQGGAGDDIYIVNDTTDVIIEAANGGVDTVFASVNYTLANEVENIGAAGAVGVTLIGNSKDNILDGTTSTQADTLIGGAGNDTYFLGVSDKVIETTGSAGGTDTVFASSAIDLTIATSANYLLGVENAILTGSAAVNILGNSLANQLSGNSAVNTLTGGAGNDILDGGLDSLVDTLIGGLGDDIYIVRAGDIVTETAGQGTDTIISSLAVDLSGLVNVENITLTGIGAVNATGNASKNLIKGNSATNILRGGAGTDTLYGLQGDDTLDGGSEADNLTGGKGNDTYLVDNTGDKVIELTGEGTDTINSGVTITSLAINVENLVLAGTALINGTGNTLANILTGNSNANVLKGLDGDDTINGMAGNDTLDGGVGADALTGGAGNDLYLVDNTGDTVTELTGGGTDTVQSSVTFSLNTASAGDDFVENLTLTGAAAISGTGNSLDNVLTGNSATNTLTGLGGNDSYYVTANDVVVEAAGGGTDTVYSAVTFSLNTAAAGDDNIENITLTGTSTGASATGNAMSNILTGNSAINTLTGLAGDDTYYVSLGDIVVEAASAGTDTVYSAGTFTLAANVENLVLTGTAVANGTGNTSANTITGNSSANILTGLDGNDTLVGNNGNDTIIGGAGRDIISVGNGVTSSTDGKDIVRFGVGVTDTVATASSIAGVDWIKDLRLNSDVIDLTGVAVTAIGTNVSGSVAESTFVSNMNTLLSVNGTPGAGFDTDAVNASIVRATSGGLSGRDFLAVDLDASGTFTVTDFVVEITGSTIVTLDQTMFA